VNQHGHEASTHLPALHVGEQPNLIRVLMRAMKLKDGSVELTKRRVTVFTGDSGSGKSSMVFGAIAAASQHLGRTLTRIWSDELHLCGWLVRGQRHRSHLI
jgi:hypothetical protein